MRWRGQLKANSKTGSELSRLLSARLLEKEAVPPQKVTTLAEMPPEKQAEMMRLYSKEKP